MKTLRHIFKLLLITLLPVAAIAQLLPLAYFDAGARAFYDDELELAKQAVFEGLDRYPGNEELQKLAELIRQTEQQQQQQQQSQQDQQNQDSQGEQGEQQQQQDSQNNEQNNQDSQDSQANNEEQQQGQEPQEPNAENQSEKSAEEYADQEIDPQEPGEEMEGQQPEDDELADASEALQNVELDSENMRAIQMTAEDADRLLNTLKEQERQLPFIITTRPEDRDARDY